MQIQTLIAIGICAIFSASAVCANNETTDFLKMWQAWNTSEVYKFSDLSLAYQCETENWVEARETSRRFIRFGKGTHNPLGTIEAMRTFERLYNVEPHPEYPQTYTMMLPRALTLKEDYRVETLPAEVVCQMDGGRPRRFIFTADAPRGWKSKRVRVVYTWNFHPFEDQSFWVPVEILMEFLVKRGPRLVVLSEHWTLKRILEGPQSEEGPLQPVDKSQVPAD